MTIRDLAEKAGCSVATDDRQVSRCAMDSLIALGHRKFVIVGG